MADASKTAKADDDQAAIEAAVTPAPPAKLSPADARSREARDAELDRQQAVVDAVAKAHDDELPKLGGAILEPGLGR